MLHEAVAEGAGQHYLEQGTQLDCVILGLYLVFLGLESATKLRDINQEGALGGGGKSVGHLL